MKPEEQRIAIHEALGRVWITSPPDYSQWMSDLTTKEAHDDLIKNHRFQSGKHAEVIDTFWKGIPDYLNDLNAMHEAEKMLNPPIQEQDREQDDPRWTAYSHYLAMACSMGTYIRATAAQRAEAFLKTLGKWKEDK